MSQMNDASLNAESGEGIETPVDFDYVNPQTEPPVGERAKAAIESLRTPGDMDPKVGDTVINEQGAGQAFTGTLADLLDGRAMTRMVEILHTGAEKYGPGSWRRIEMMSHVNHAMTHLFAGLDGRYGWTPSVVAEDHLGHAFTRLMMALALRERGGDSQTEATMGRAPIPFAPPPLPLPDNIPPITLPVARTLDEFIKGQHASDVRTGKAAHTEAHEIFGKVIEREGVAEALDRILGKGKDHE